MALGPSANAFDGGHRELRDTAPTNVTVGTSNSITAMTPPHTVGAVSVVVTNPVLEAMVTPDWLARLRAQPESLSFLLKA